MTINTIIKEAIRKTTGLTVYKRLPFGIEPLSDILHILSSYRFRVIFDVGANIGQSAVIFNRIAPSAIIHCFEPCSQTFEILKKNHGRRKNIMFNQVAIGNMEGTGQMVLEEHSDLNRLVTVEDPANKTGKGSCETVALETLSGYCRRNNLSHIDYLKIDTEGFDLEVLKSGRELLEDASIDFVEVEVSMNPTNKRHVAFEVIKQYLERDNYFLFGIYEQVQEWVTKKPFLRRSNAVFISGRLSNQ